MQRLWVCFIVGLHFVLSASTATGQSSLQPRHSIPDEDVRHFIGANAGVSEVNPLALRMSSKELNEALLDTRDVYFNLYPDKPGLLDAGRELNIMLVAKDIQILRHMISRYTINEVVNASGSTIPVMINRDYDDGIPPIADGAHRQWAYTVLTNMNLLDLSKSYDERSESLNDALKKAAPYLDIYHDARDYAEFHRAGRPGDYFPNGLSLVQFALRFNMNFPELEPRSNEQMLALYQVFVDHYGEEAVEEAGEILRTSQLSNVLKPANYEELGIPRAYVDPYSALIFLMGREAAPDVFAVGILRTRGLSVHAFSDGRARYDAMVSAHGESKVHAAAVELQSIALDPRTGLITQGPHAGSSRQQALMAMLPLDHDPGQERFEQRRADRIAAREKAHRESWEKEMRLRMISGRSKSEAHYANLREAYELAIQVDELRKGNTDFAEAVLDVAGYWNLHAKVDSLENAGAAAYQRSKHLARHTPKEYRKKFSDLLAFTSKHTYNTQSRRLVPIELIQREWISEGKIAEGDALDLSSTPFASQHQHNVELAEQYLEGRKSAKPASSMSSKANHKQRDLDLAEQRLAHHKKLLAEYLAVGPNLTGYKPHPDEIARQHYESLRQVRLLAESFDEVWLKELNENLAEAGLGPQDDYPFMAVFADLLAASWNQYLVTQDESYLDGMYFAQRRLVFEDKSGLFLYNEFTDFMDPPKEEEDWPLPPAPVQATLLATSQIPAEQAIEFRVTQEMTPLLSQWRDHVYNLGRLARKSYGSGEQGEARKRQVFEEQFAIINEVQQQIAALDEAAGIPPRVRPLVLTPLARTADPISEPDVSTPIKPTDNQQAKSLPGNAQPVTGQRRPDSTTATTPEVAVENPDPSAEELNAFLEALRLAREAEAIELAALNEERESLGLEPVEAYASHSEWIHMAAGFWDRFARTGEREDYNMVSRSLSRMRSMDRQVSREINQALSMTRENLSRASLVQRTPIGDVQAAQLEAGELSEDLVLVLRASQERYDLLRAVLDARADLLRQEVQVAQRLQTEMPDSAKQRFLDQVERRRNKLDQARQALEAFDAQAE